MRWRLITLIVMTYLALDVGDPLMPGAFQLVGACIKSVDACPERSVEALPPAPLALPPRLVLADPHANSELRPVDPVSRVPRDTPFLARPSLDARGPAPSSPGDH